MGALDDHFAQYVFHEQPMPLFCGTGSETHVGSPPGSHRGHQRAFPNRGRSAQPLAAQRNQAGVDARSVMALFCRAPSMVGQASSASEWQDMLSGRLPMREVRACGKRLAYDGMFRDTLYRIMADGDSRMAENAAWIFTYADTDLLPSLPPHYVDTWMERAMDTRSETLRRLLLTLISRSVLPHPFRTDFLDYCLIGMSSSRYPYSVRALCMKLAYKLCLPHPELLDELKSNLEIMEPDLLPPSLRSVRCRVMVGIVSQKRG